MLSGLTFLNKRLNMIIYICLKRQIEHALWITVPGLLTTDGRKHPEQPTADLPLDSGKITDNDEYSPTQIFKLNN